MAKIKPFKGVHYDGVRSGSYEDLIAPPYDVISPERKKELYRKSEHNIVRLTLGEERPSDGPGDNKYSRARSYLEQWLTSGILVRDEEPSLYICVQDYDFNGRPARRTGFMALCRIDDGPDNFVMPHERTHSKPKADRLELIKHVEADLSPVFTLFDDSRSGIVKNLKVLVEGEAPCMDLSLEGVRNRLWRISDEKTINDIASKMADKRLFIADGHHRYEVAKTYRDLRRAEEGYRGQADHVMMYLTDLSDPDNLTVMATHRAVKKDAWRARPVEELTDLFEITDHKGIEELLDTLEKANASEKVIGFYDGQGFKCLRLKDHDTAGKIVSGNADDQSCALDVSVLHSAVLDRLLPEGLEEGDITYLMDAEEAVGAVDQNSHSAAFFLRPTPVWQMKDMAERGQMMPQKSTYFYPKVLTGLVFHKFE